MSSRLLSLISTDRPDFTDVATTVGKGVTQVESVWTYSYRNTSIDRFREHTLPEFKFADTLCDVQSPRPRAAE